MKHYVYILLCKDNTFYTGYTTDIKKRVTAHNKGKGAKYTRSRLPVKVAFLEPHQTKSQALKREYQIKQLSRKKKVELIASQYA